jgi:hypothetical protein
LFIAPSLPFLRRELEGLVRRFGIPLLPEAGQNGQRNNELDARIAQSMGENTAWFQAHQSEILSRHPDWYGKYLAISCHTASKIVAVNECRSKAIEDGMNSPEVSELAKQEGLQPGMLVIAVPLGDLY